MSQQNLEASREQPNGCTTAIFGFSGAIAGFIVVAAIGHIDTHNHVSFYTILSTLLGNTQSIYIEGPASLWIVFALYVIFCAGGAVLGFVLQHWLFRRYESIGN